MSVEIKFMKVEVFFKGGTERVRGKVDHGHVVVPDEIVCDYIRRNLFLCFVGIQLFDASRTCGDDVGLWGVGDMER